MPHAVLLSLLLSACASPEAGDDSGTNGGRTTGWQPPGAGVVTLTTRDGVDLEADYTPASAQGRPGVVLLHMIPPNNDRTNWPDDFIAALTAMDWAVLNLDRRGAGGSEGSPTDAYEGEAGRYDVEAAFSRLAADGYGAVGVMGASNGTTSMIDHAAWAAAEGLPRPVVLAFLTGGTYTENQTSMDLVVDLPAVFAVQSSENAWTEEQRDRDPGTWSFHEYLGAGHGTQMLDSDYGEELTEVLRGAFEAVLGP